LLFEQVVGALVAIVAAGEFTQHLFVMRRAVAFLAFGNIAVLIGVAENTLKISMQGRP
jgi:hypothetical protein